MNKITKVVNVLVKTIKVLAVWALNTLTVRTLNKVRYANAWHKVKWLGDQKRVGAIMLETMPIGNAGGNVDMVAMFCTELQFGGSLNGTEIVKHSVIIPLNSVEIDKLKNYANLVSYTLPGSQFTIKDIPTELVAGSFIAHELVHYRDYMDIMSEKEGGRHAQLGAFTKHFCDPTKSYLEQPGEIRAFTKQMEFLLDGKSLKDSGVLEF